MSEERPETCPICHTPVVWCTCKGEKPMDEMGEELYLDEDFRMLAKTYPADVSAIGVTALIDYVEALEAELARRDEELALTEKKLCNIDRSARAEVARRDEKISELEAIVSPVSFRKFLVEQIKDPELAEAYVKACIQDTTYKELLAHRDKIITRLKEDGERLASTYVVEVFPHEWVCRGGCHHWARFGEQIDHAPDCPITIHHALMKELEKK